MNRPILALSDWKKDLKLNVFEAYFKGKLRRNDYMIINSLIACFLLLVAMAVLVSINQRNTVGVTIAVPFLHYGLAAFSFIRVLNTFAKMSLLEILTFFAAFGF